MFLQQWTFIFLGAIYLSRTNCLNIIPLDDSNIFIEKLRTTYIYSEKIDITIGLENMDIFKNFENLKQQLELVKQYCKENCGYQHEISGLHTRIKKIENLILHLKLSTHNRPKRGLLNIIGSASKALFGTFDNDDLELVNKNIDKLFDENNKVKTMINNQTALIRKIIDSENLEKLTEINKYIVNQERKHNLNELLTNMIIRIENTAYDLHLQIDEIFNVIILGKQGIISPQIIDHQQFIRTYKRILGNKLINPTIVPSESNFQFILDISSLTLWTIQSKIFFRISIPLLEDTEWTI
ncbi:uncharacterized protein LOC143264970 [Megachile rotundata]|uniref:uncharacterized protein LOC143264970 n=1 Tax=Megachile rotundata TaxID=143995 RepID=UPI003FD41E56